MSAIPLKAMRTLVLDPPPPQLEELLERRRRMGVDRRDEVWAGVYHMVPGPSGAHSLIVQQVGVMLDAPARAAGLRVSVEFNMGVKDDFRMPDLGIHRERPLGVWIPTAAIAVEILSPQDETWEKLPFYAEHEVDELVIVSSQDRSVTWLALREGEYRPTDRSAIIDLSASELADRIDWPPSSS
jgi:Uma2 family endonuclease